MRHPWLIPTILLAYSTAGLANPWQMVAEESRLDFTFLYDGGPLSGAFESFDVAVTFDLDDPGAAELEVLVDVTSVNTRNEERDEILAESDWFNFSTYPKAVFRATGFGPAQSRQWRAVGNLMLKDVTREQTIYFDWRREGEGIRLEGQALMIGGTMVDRMDYNIGVGEWEDPELIGHEVEVSFSVLLEAGTR